MEGNTEIQSPFQEQLKPESQTLNAERGWLKGLKDRVNSVFGKEEGKGMVVLPKIQFDVFYAHHGTKEDKDGLAERLKNADVYIPEFFDWTGSVLNMFRDHAAGKGRLFKGPPGLELNFTLGLDPTLQEELRIIYGSHKAIGMIDMKEPFWAGAFLSERDSIKQDRIMIHKKGKDSFIQRLDFIRNLLEREARFQNKRERHMISQLRPTLQEIIKAYPSLQNKSEIKVLLSLGSAHTFVYHNLKEDNHDTTRGFSRMPEVYDFESEAIRRFIFARGVDDDLVSKVYLEGLFSNSYETSDVKDSSKIGKCTRKLVSQFSFEEAKEIFEGVNKGDKPRQLFENKFVQKGIQLPRTEKDMDDFLAKPLPRPDTMQE